MQDAPMLDFSPQVYEKRLGALQAGMRAQGLAAVMLTTQYSLRYFCGFQSVVWISKISTPGILIVAHDGRRRLIGSFSAYETMKYTCCLAEDELLYYGASRGQRPRPGTYVQAICDTLREFILNERENAQMDRAFLMAMLSRKSEAQP